MPTRRSEWGVLALILAATGCGGTIKPVPVAGTVTLDGKPLADATVRFLPVGEGHGAFGRTDENGNFKLTTFSTNDGALPGEYKITLSVDEVAKEPVRAAPKGMNPKIQIMQTQMKQGKRPKASVIPAPYLDAARTPLRQRVPPEGKVNLDLDSKMR